MLENPAITNMSAAVDWIEDPESPSPQRCKVIVSGATDRDVRRQTFSLMADVDLFGGWAVFTDPCRQQSGTFAALGVVEVEAAPCSAI